MSHSLIFELPSAWLFGLPLVALLGLLAWRQHRAGLAPGRLMAIFALRMCVLLALLFLAARPVRQAHASPGSAFHPVVVLMDRSESMSLKDSDNNRYERALDFLGTRLLPALKSADFHVQGMLFDQSAQFASGPELVATKPAGRRTNLGGAIAQALNLPQMPLAIVALTDGESNDFADNTRAATKLIENGVPFIGVGFGSDLSVQSLGIRNFAVPDQVAPKAPFSLAVELETMRLEENLPVELVLLRDGELFQRKTTTLAKGSHASIESFQAIEQSQGVHTYTLKMLAPGSPDIRCLNNQAAASVRVADHSQVRALYVQGTLTWDYKFINLALQKDANVKLTGLTRTSKESVFRQNIDSASELMNGFPTSLAELAPFRVVVLSNLRPEDLSLEQQELLCRFCGELGGGLLMIGGSDTFNSSWHGSRLEKLIPVEVCTAPAQQSVDPFQIQLTPAALQQPLFHLVDQKPALDVWKHLPPFSQFGRVEQAKLGAQVWFIHPTERGPHGPRILMASQKYGAGLSSVLTIQNFWRWRLAKDCDPDQFDRFWRQMFRWLGQIDRPQVSIALVEQELRPQSDVRISLQRQADAGLEPSTNSQFLLEVRNSKRQRVQNVALELPDSNPVELRFFAAEPDMYSLSVLDKSNVLISSRTIEVRDQNPELEQTARNMETLNQWAAISHGLAFKAEECPSASDLVGQIKAKAEQMRGETQARRAIGLNSWMLSLILGCLCGEWLLRKRWALI